MNNILDYHFNYDDDNLHDFVVYINRDMLYRCFGMTFNELNTMIDNIETIVIAGEKDKEWAEILELLESKNIKVNGGYKRVGSDNTV